MADGVRTADEERDSYVRGYERDVEAAKRRVEELKGLDAHASVVKEAEERLSNARQALRAHSAEGQKSAEKRGTRKAAEKAEK